MGSIEHEYDVYALGIRVVGGDGVVGVVDRLAVTLEAYLPFRHTRTAAR